VSGDLDALLREQVAYYRARAGEYDLLYEQRADLAAPEEVLDGLPITGDVLELACGTGQWTRILAGRGHRVTAVDAAPEMLAIARERVPEAEFLQADLFEWRPPRRFDTVFFAAWLSHVPPARFAAFWELVAAALRPGGRACFVDTGPPEEASEDVLAGQPAPAVRRRLADGSEHRVVKVFPEPAALTASLTELGWAARVWSARGTLICGYVSR
jgi:demethylmenaquinone methyltransferase/2-methoxy-6-polyprenyl-1,4-benzoquinol methylase